MTLSINNTLRAAQDTLSGINAMHKRIKELESRAKRYQARAEHYRALTLVQSKEITRLKKGLKP